MNNADISRLTDDQLLIRAEYLAADLRKSRCDLIEALALIDDRTVYRWRRYDSLHDYCVFKLRMSDSAAFRHIRAARAIRLFPPISELLRSGRLTLEAVVILHPFLQDADASSLVHSASGRRVAEVEKLLAPRRTESPKREVVRLVATSALTPVPHAEEPLLTAIVEPKESPPPAPPVPEEPLVPASILPPMEGPPTHAVRIAFTADESFFRLLRRAQGAMRHKYPNGRLDGVFRDALEALLRKKIPWAYRKEKKGKPQR